MVLFGKAKKALQFSFLHKPFRIHKLQSNLVIKFLQNVENSLNGDKYKEKSLIE